MDSVRRNRPLFRGHRSIVIRISRLRDRDSLPFEALKHMTTIDPYNPLDLEALGLSLIRELERRPSEPLSDLTSFAGSGIYALYYIGARDPYAEIGAFNVQHKCALPIYIGRAKEPGARQGLNPFEPVTQPLLWSRINQHRRSIKDARNLDVDDFRVSALVCMPIWIPLAESVAIRRYRPLWNSQLQGFGIHAPGSGRSGQERSQWDELHPGRGFATNLRPNRLGRALLAQTRTAAKESVAACEAEMHHQAALAQRGHSAPKTRRPRRA